MTIGRKAFSSKLWCTTCHYLNQTSQEKSRLLGHVDPFCTGYSVKGPHLWKSGEPKRTIQATFEHIQNEPFIRPGMMSFMSFTRSYLFEFAILKAYHTRLQQTNQSRWHTKLHQENPPNSAKPVKPNSMIKKHMDAGNKHSWEAEAIDSNLQKPMTCLVHWSHLAPVKMP